MNSKLPNLIHLLATYCRHNIRVMKTWLHADSYVSEVTPAVFGVVRIDRQHSLGSGVAIFLKSYLSFFALRYRSGLVRSSYRQRFLKFQCVLFSLRPITRSVNGGKRRKTSAFGHDSALNNLRFFFLNGQNS